MENLRLSGIDKLDRKDSAISQDFILQAIASLESAQECVKDTDHSSHGPRSARFSSSGSKKRLYLTA